MKLDSHATAPHGRAPRAPVRTLLAAALLGGGLTFAPPAVAGELLAPPPAAPAAPDHRLVDEDGKALKAALSDASSAKRAAQKLEGDERVDALLSVAAQYLRIADNESFAAGGRAEAAFRAGEVLRSADRDTDAEGTFQRAVTLGEESVEGREFAARALLEVAHFKRRAKDAEGALALYTEVGARFSDQRRSAAHAATWTGKLLLKAGQREEAAPILLGFAEAWPEYPAEAVRNADLLAVEQVEAGEEAAAQATLAQIKSAMEPVIAKGGKEAEAAQKALDSMRATDLLSGY